MENNKFLLPTNKTTKQYSFETMTTLLYGQSKIGKTRLCSEFENALFISTEDGLPDVSVYNCRIRTWDEYRNVLKELKTTEHKFSPIIIDTLGGLYDLCLESICKKLKINSPEDSDFGKAWKETSKNLMSSLDLLDILGQGIILIAHSKEVIINKRDGNAITCTVPNLAPSFITKINAFVHNVFFCKPEFEDNKKSYAQIKTRETAEYYAGSRYAQLPETIDMSANAFIQAIKKLNNN